MQHCTDFGDHSLLGVDRYSCRICNFDYCGGCYQCELKGTAERRMNLGEDGELKEHAEQAFESLRNSVGRVMVGGTFFLVNAAGIGGPEVALLTAAHVIRPLGPLQWVDADVKRVMCDRRLEFSFSATSEFREPVVFRGTDLAPDTFFHFSPPRKDDEPGLDFIVIALSDARQKFFKAQARKLFRLEAIPGKVKKNECVVGAMYLHRSVKLIRSVGKMNKNVSAGDSVGSYSRGGAEYAAYIQRYSSGGGASGSPVVLVKPDAPPRLLGVHYDRGKMTLVNAVIKRTASKKSAPARGSLPTVNPRKFYELVRDILKVPNPQASVELGKIGEAKLLSCVCNW